MTTPLCDASMQKKKKEKEKKKDFNTYLVVSHIVVHWDDVG
jgi:hypothetical protein